MCTDDSLMRDPSLPLDQKCKSKEEIQTFTEQLYLNFYVASREFDFTSPIPIKLVGSSTYTTLSSKFPKEVDLKLD